MTFFNELSPTLPATISILIVAIIWYKFRLSSSRSYGAPPLPPGPRGLPIVGYLPFLSHELHKQFTKLSHSYGPIFKVQVGSKIHVVINNLDLAKAVLREQDDTFANRSPPIAGSVSTYGGQDIVWSDNNSYWRNLRKIFVHEALSNRNLEACQCYRRDEVRKTIKNVFEKMGTPIDINEISFSTEANVITSMLWENTSAELGAKGDRLIAELQVIVTEIVKLVSKPNISDLFPTLAWFDLQGVERETKKQLKLLDRIFTSVIDGRRKTSSRKLENGVDQDHGKKDFLQILLDLKEEKNETSFNITQIKSVLVDIMVAGTETTTTLIEWAMAEIMQDQKIMKRVQKELVDVVGLNNIVEESHLQKLEYLEALIKETFRLHPVVPLLLPRSPSQSCTVGGYTVPKGCTVSLNVWAIHRDPAHWDNPLEFNPERFLKNKMDYKGNNLNFLPFGAGRRLCPGVPLAEKMLMYVLASLLHSFDWSLPKGEELDLAEKFGIVLKKEKPLIAIPSQRLPNESLYM